MTDRDRLIAMMDRHQPNWWIDHATQTDLQDLARKYSSEQTVKARVAERLMMPVRAAIEAGLVCLPQTAA